MPGPKGAPGICSNCKKEKDYIPVYGKSRGLCKTCYNKLIWNPKLRLCKRCGGMKKHQAKGLCPGCYNSVFHIDKVKEANIKKYFNNLDYPTYKKLTEKCVICGFSKIVDLHHLDLNHKNNDPKNLIGLCPNHHKLLHDRRFRNEVFEELKQKGFEIPKVYASDEEFKSANKQNPQKQS